MRIFNYHPISHVFLGEALADKSPLDESEYLIPAHATTDCPPHIPEGYFASYNGKGWDINPVPEIEQVVQPEPSASDALKAMALDALAASDWIVIRSAERGEEVPAAYCDYRDLLRLVASGELDQMPDQPDPKIED